MPMVTADGQERIELYADVICLTNDQVMALGHVAIESARFERVIEEKIRVLTLAPKTPHGLQGKLTKLRDLVAGQLANEADSTALNWFSDAYEAWCELILRRNVYVHGAWIGRTASDGELYNYAVDQRDRERLMNAGDIIHTAGDLATACSTLNRFFVDFSEALSEKKAS